MIRAYTGKTGSGKTFLMIKDAYEFYKRGVNIYSNTILSFPKKKKGGKIKYFENINEVIDIKEGLVIFDEAQVLFSSRAWENLSDEFQYKLQQHRKHKIDLICTTQNMGAIDIVYRRLVHQWFHCKAILTLGSSPRIVLGLFNREEKDIDYLYNQVDDLQVPVVKKKFFIINLFTRALYDTMYDIGFKRYKTLWLSYLGRDKQRMYLILPKKMSKEEAFREIGKLRNMRKLLKVR